MEAADRLVAGHAAMRPRCAGVVLRLDQREAVAVRSIEAQAVLAERRVALDAGNAFAGQPLLPIAERVFRHRKHRRADLADAMPALADIREREVGHHRARRAELVGIIEMVDVGRVEIDGLLDPAQAELVGEELIVLPRIAGHRRDVMQALDLVEHDGSSGLMERVARHMAPAADRGQEREHRMNCPLMVNERASIVHRWQARDLAFTAHLGSMAAAMRRKRKTANDAIRQTTKLPADHLRPMARRVPFRRRPPHRQDAQRRRAGRRRRHVSRATMPAQRLARRPAPASTPASTR